MSARVRKAQSLSFRRYRRMVQALLIAPLMIVAFVLLPGSPAQAKTIAVTYGYGFAFADSVGYWGGLRDTTTPDGYCVQMERKTSAGAWVVTGFWSTYGPDGGDPIYVTACSTTVVEWHIRNPGAVYGLRLIRYPSGPATNFCSTKAECLAL
jgi:hypothetical protein